MRQSARKRVGNLKKRRAIDSIMKKIRLLQNRQKMEEAIALLPQAYKTFDKAAKTNVISKNTASRYKSRLTKRLQKR